MSTLIDSVELLELLDSTELHVFNEVRKLIVDGLSNIKEVWLVNALVDSFTVSHSSRCLDILSTIAEPHDKHLLDRLLDHMKGSAMPSHKMEALLIVAHLVRHEPVWLHKLVDHPLLALIIKCLKTEKDVLSLLIGCLSLTALLPVVPVAIGRHLTDIFDIFVHLAKFTFDITGNWSKIYTLHLRVGVQCMFHRLYGMYPCNLVSYLRNIYCRPENRPVFTNVIEPMLCQVRMHPLLVIATRDVELSRDRWKEMEVHDIIVECSRLSLDAVSQRLSDFSTTTCQSNRLEGADAVAKHHKLQFSSLAVEERNAWSPSMTSGLSTPPPPTVNKAPELMTKQASTDAPGTVNNVNATMSPIKKETTVSDKKEFETPGKRSQPSIVLPPVSSSRDPARTESISLPATPHPTDRSGSAPSLFADQHSKAIMKLSFEKPVCEEAAKFDSQLDFSGRSLSHSGLVSCSQTGDTSVPHDTSICDVRASVTSAAVDIKAEQSGKAASLGALVKSDASLPSKISVSSSTDDELSDVHHAMPSSTHLTAANVAAFMKKVKRLRVDSQRERLNLQRNDIYSGSCPTLHFCENTGGSDTSSNDDMSFVDSGERLRIGQRRSERVTNFSFTSCSVGMSMMSPTFEHRSWSESRHRSVAALSLATAETQTCYYVASMTGKQTFDEEMLEDNGTHLAMIEIEDLLGLVLPQAPFVQCYGCLRSAAAKQTKDVVDGKPFLFSGKAVASMYSMYSPVDLLDQHIIKSLSVHDKLSQESNDRLNHSASAVRSGAVSAGIVASSAASSSAVASSEGQGSTRLRDEVALLHNQLMFEQHRQEMHARRNRRLLGRTVKVVSLEEQNTAMKDQLRLQEVEMIDLRQNLHSLQQLNATLKSSLEKQNSDADRQQKANSKLIESLQANVKELENNLQTKTSHAEDLVKKLDEVQNKLFSSEKDLGLLRTKAENASALNLQIDQLNRELLLMGELHEKYQQRLSSMSRSHNDKPELQRFLQSAKAECTALSKSVEEKNSSLQSEQTKVFALEQLLKQKESCIAEQKKLLESTKAMHRDQVQNYEAQLKAGKKLTHTSQNKILELECQLAQAQLTQTQAAVQASLHSKMQSVDQTSLPEQTRLVESQGDAVGATCAAVAVQSAGKKVKSVSSDVSSSPGSVEDAAVACDQKQGFLSGEDDAVAPEQKFS